MGRALAGQKVPRQPAEFVVHQGNQRVSGRSFAPAPTLEQFSYLVAGRSSTHATPEARAAPNRRTEGSPLGHESQCAWPRMAWPMISRKNPMLASLFGALVFSQAISTSSLRTGKVQPCGTAQINKSCPHEPNTPAFACVWVEADLENPLEGAQPCPESIFLQVGSLESRRNYELLYTPAGMGGPLFAASLRRLRHGASRPDSVAKHKSIEFRESGNPHDQWYSICHSQEQRHCGPADHGHNTTDCPFFRNQYLLFRVTPARKVLHDQRDL